MGISSSSSFPEMCPQAAMPGPQDRVGGRCWGRALAGGRWQWVKSWRAQLAPSKSVTGGRGDGRQASVGGQQPLGPPLAIPMGEGFICLCFPAVGI